MAKREQFRLPGMPIETGVDNGQRWFIEAPKEALNQLEDSNV